jgi:hypothetical protein
MEVRKLALAAALVAASAASPAATAAAAPRLESVILRPAQVGKGYLLFPYAQGIGLRQRTLDLCGTTNYPSEKLRVERLQVNYAKRGSAFQLSDEVVRYRPGGAAQALREVTRHALTCPHRPIAPGEQGLPPLTFRITRITDAHLLKGYLAVEVRTTGTLKGKHVDQVSYAVYQRLGNVFVGVYTIGPRGSGQRDFCLHAAEQSARNLRASHLGGPPA